MRVCLVCLSSLHLSTQYFSTDIFYFYLKFLVSVFFALQLHECKNCFLKLCFNMLQNFTVLYIKMGFPRLPGEQQTSLLSQLVSCIPGRPEPQQNR